MIIDNRLAIDSIGEIVFAWHIVYYLTVMTEMLTANIYIYMTFDFYDKHY